MQDDVVKVVVAGGTGVLGRAAVPALLAAGHQVSVICRSAENEGLVAALGATPIRGNVFDLAALSRLLEGADALINLTSNIPVGYSWALPASWKRNDDLRDRGTQTLVAAAAAAGVRVVVQASASALYADAGDEWITERSALDITSVTEPLAMAEAHVQRFGVGVRSAVVLRFGSVVGNDPQTRFWLRAAATGRPVGVGRPRGWAHLVHTDDLGSAIAASLTAPSGIYNVGAKPVRRGELASGYASAVGSEQAAFLGPVLRRLSGARLEPLARSLRVSSDRFAATTGWTPSRAAFDLTWFDAARPSSVSRAG